MNIFDMDMETKPASLRKALVAMRRKLKLADKMDRKICQRRTKGSIVYILRKRKEESDATASNPEQVEDNTPDDVAMLL